MPLFLDRYKHRTVNYKADIYSAPSFIELESDPVSILLSVECFHTNGAAPGSFWSNLHRRYKAVHVVSSVAVVAEEKLVVVLGGAAQRARLALDALPGVLAHAHHHVLGELQARWVSCSAAY